MAKQVKTKYLVTIPVTDLAPEGETPLKAKDVLATLDIALPELDLNEETGEETQPRLTLGKAKVEVL